jgi:hypothetical protein
MEMNLRIIGTVLLLPLIAFSGVFISGCGAQPVTNVTTNSANSNTNAAGNMNSNVASAAGADDVGEPNEYQARVTVRFEAIGGAQNLQLPTLTADVARSGDDRRMEFAMPAGGRVVYLDKAGKNYLVLPDKRQYAEADRDSLGFEVRRLMMPEQIVERVRGVRGVERVGEESYQGRQAIRYRYAAVTDTRSQAGTVATESFMLVDKETGLPLRSETVSQSQSGGNVQGYSGVRIVTEMSEIRTDAPDDLFREPTDLQKIESEQVRAQVNMIFNTVGAFIAQMMRQNAAPASPGASPTVSPTP